MALQAIIDATTHSSLPDALKSEYIQSGDSYRLDVTAVNGVGLEDVSGLKSALEKERAAAREALAKVKAFDGLDVDAAREAMKKLKEQAGQPGVEELAKQLAESQIKQMAAKHSEENQGLQAKLQSITGQLQDKLVKSAALEALQAHGGNAKLLLPHLEASVRMRPNDSGQFIAEVIDPMTGNPRVGDSQGNPMTIPQLVESMKANADYAAAFTGTGATGSGTTGATGFSRQATTSKSVKRISRNDQAAVNSNLEGLADGSVVFED